MRHSVHIWRTDSELDGLMRNILDQMIHLSLHRTGGERL
jgi:hypothetical protein